MLSEGGNYDKNISFKSQPEYFYQEALVREAER